MPRLTSTAATGLGIFAVVAGSIGYVATRAGWRVAAIGDWRGKIETSTVYYPAGQQRAARRLGAALGIDRTRPRLDSMPPDRLTVIVTAGYPD